LQDFSSSRFRKSEDDSDSRHEVDYDFSSYVDEVSCHSQLSDHTSSTTIAKKKRKLRKPNDSIPIRGKFWQNVFLIDSFFSRKPF